MAYVQEEEPTTDTRTITLAERVRSLERKEKIARRSEQTIRETKQFRYPFRWRLKFNKSRRRTMSEKMLVIFLNKKNEIEPPKFMPIFDGNMIVWKNKPYEFDPRAVWRVKGVRKNPQAYLIKEIDRRPVRNKKGRIVYRDAAVSNMDVDEIRNRGDSTESDEFLIKAALKAQTTQARRNINIALIVILGIVGVGVLMYFLFGG